MKDDQKNPRPSSADIDAMFNEKPVHIKTPYPKPKDDVNHPDHYTHGIEVTDFLASWEMDWFRGNIIKYIVRCPYKNNGLKDLKKAKWYLEDLIKRVEKEEYTLQ